MNKNFEWQMVDGGITFYLGLNVKGFEFIVARASYEVMNI